MTEQKLYRVMAYCFAAFACVITLQVFARTLAGYSLTVRATDQACVGAQYKNPFARGRP
jgi:hypothetical protein